MQFEDRLRPSGELECEGFNNTLLLLEASRVAWLPGLAILD